MRSCRCKIKSKKKKDIKIWTHEVNRAIEIPASSDDPPPRPSPAKNTRPKRGKTLAIEDLKGSLSARTDPTWFGYDSAMYIRMDRKVRKIPGRYNGDDGDDPVRGRSPQQTSCQHRRSRNYGQFVDYSRTEAREVHPNANSEIGMKMLPIRSPGVLQRLTHRSVRFHVVAVIKAIHTDLKRISFPQCGPAHRRRETRCHRRVMDTRFRCFELVYAPGAH